MVDSNKTFFMADRNSRKESVKTIDGNLVLHVATQVSRRSRRKRTVHVYYIANTNIVIFNRSRAGTFFMKMALRPENVQNFYDTFVKPPNTAEETKWLKRYDYVLD